MFSKLQQSIWIKIEVVLGYSTQECFHGLRQACGDAVLPDCTVSRWVKAFLEGGDAVHDSFRTGRPYVENNTVQLLNSLLDADRR